MATNPSLVRNIIMLANGHPPFDTRIFVKEARTLAKVGYAVSLIVPHTHSEVRDDVKVIAVPLTTKGWHKLVVNPWNILKAALRQPKKAIYQIHDSDILLVGVVLKLLGRKVIYDAHEDTPLQISYQHWLPTILKKPYAWFYYGLEKICGWLFDAIIVAEPIIARYFPPRKTFLVRNFPIAESFRMHAPVPYPTRHQQLVYVGTLSKVRGLYEMLDGAKQAQQQILFEFVLGGKFAPLSLEQHVLQHYQVTFPGWVSYQGLVDLLFHARIGIIIPHPIERYKTNYPVKLFEFMAAGLPVIASREGEASAFVREANAGILVDPLNVKEIADAMLWLFQHPEEAEAMGKRGQHLIFTKYNWEEESKTLLQVYAKIV